MYVGKGFEEVTRIDKDGKTITEAKHYVYAGGQAIAIHIRTHIRTIKSRQILSGIYT